MTIHIYGIPNCDTVKKARRWLDANSLEYIFHDYKKEGVNEANLSGWADKVGWEVLLNRRGTTYRKLDESVKNGIDRGSAQALMAEHPSMIKRPVVTYDGGVVVGFTEAIWENAFL